ncbi:MAG: hypothetical protein ACC669_00755 [bacterium]
MRFGKWLFILVLVFGIISAIKVGTPYLRNWMFKGVMEEQARLLSVNTVSRAKSNLMQEARGNKIPITEEQLIVRKDRATGQVLIETEYSVTVEIIPNYSYTWRFHPKVETRVAVDKRLNY